ncbi:MAG TPA: hypothetical protein VFO11_00660, partial [Candidatus Polarisedimenticolaceae bacterium]|nr:hypothetical protein [Candidatus Polarisedimenticolaceae bacterium]
SVASGGAQHGDPVLAQTLDREDGDTFQGANASRSERMWGTPGPPLPWSASRAADPGVLGIEADDDRDRAALGWGEEEPETSRLVLEHLKQNGTPEGAVQRREDAVENQKIHGPVSEPAS